MLLLITVGCDKLKDIPIEPYDGSEKGYFVGSINHVYYRGSDLEVHQNDANGIYVVMRGSVSNRKVVVKVRCENKIQAKKTDTTDTNILVIETIAGVERAYSIADGAVSLIKNNGELKLGFTGLSADRQFQVSNVYFWK